MSASSPKSPAALAFGKYSVYIPSGITRIMQTMHISTAPSSPDEPDHKEDPASSSQLAWVAFGMLAVASTALMPKSAPLILATLKVTGTLLMGIVKPEDIVVEESVNVDQETLADENCEACSEKAGIPDHEPAKVEERVVDVSGLEDAAEEPHVEKEVVAEESCEKCCEEFGIPGDNHEEKKCCEDSCSDDEDKLSPTTDFEVTRSPLNPSATPFKPASHSDSTSTNSNKTLSQSSYDSDSSLDTEVYSSNPEETSSAASSSSSPQNSKDLPALPLRVQYLQYVLAGYMDYQPTKLLPENVNLALSNTRKNKSPRISVDLEILLVQAMIYNEEIGQSTSSIDWDAWWIDSNNTLHEKYSSLAQIFFTLANSF